MENKSRFAPQFVHQLVENTADTYPDAVALILGDTSVMYQQLNDQADAVCEAILTIDPGAELIGVSSTRSLEMVIGVLAVLKAGKAYLPLDPAYPEQRLQQICSDSGVRTCITLPQDAPLFERLGLRVVSDADKSTTALSANQANSTAYVLYTSGSTGKPKGVCMGHGPLLNLLAWQADNSEATVGTRTLQLAPLSFDVSFQEIFATLSTAGTLMLIDEALRLDLNALLAFIDEQSINRLFLPFVALQYLAEVAVTTQRFPKSLREVMTAGEQLKVTPQLIAFFSALPGCVLFNQYGPTECHVVSQLKLAGNPSEWPSLPSIGKAIDNVGLFIADEQLTLLPDGEAGELLIAGDCLAEGYLHQAELTQEKFVELAIPEQGTMRIYRTGDLARYQPDGTIEFLGRRDDQVKIRGHRVELGELEVSINQIHGVKQAVVVAREAVGGQKQLIAYLVASAESVDKSVIRKELEQRLPEYMMPSAFVWMADFPKTSSGKVDKKQLPIPERKRPELAVVYRKPKAGVEQQIASIWADLLQLDKVGLDDNFFELGGNSLLAQKLVAALKQAQHTLPITKLYQYPTVAGVTHYLQPRFTGSVTRLGEEKADRPANQADVAVIGMAGRFPGATTINEFWEILKQGRETTRFFTDDELDATIPDKLKNDPLYVKARGVIDNADQFDPQFFGLPPTVAQLMDPQQRIFLEIAWEALEQTGYLPQRYGGRVGVFAGCGNNTYYLNNVLTNKELVDQIGAFQVMTLNEKDYIASRTAYQLNLKGPAVSVYSACSTSLLAITQAVQSIRSGQCDVALAGGATVTAPIYSGHLYQEGAMLSKDGHCRSFDAQGQGTVFSDGAGVVLLKNLEAAQRDGDTVYAVIKGVGVNNDGAGKGSFTAPNAEGQAGAIAMALTDAAVDPATISYVEAHGTATPLGDPIEIDGLTIAFGEQPETQYCAIGSLKSNMGHLTQAAGVAGLIKAALALHHKQIPASLNFSTPNPAINFTDSPFFVNTKLTDWTLTGVRQHKPRRAGVSSFGVGGTNVHIVLEEFTQAVPAPASTERPVELITWSAKSPVSRDAYGNRLAGEIHQNSELALADVAFTLQTTRPDFNHRRFAVASTNTELVEKLSSTTAISSTAKTLKETPGEVVFMFPGQGAQFLNMGRMLYEHEPVFRRAVDECAELLITLIEGDIRQVIYPQTADLDAEHRLRNTRYTQPALFVTEYALARLWMSWGIEPTVFCGHSIGEFVAAHLAGVFSLSDALTLIATRGKMVSEQPRGSMLSVRMDVATLQAMMPASLSVAAVNSPKLCVVAGPDEHIADFVRLLDDQEIINQPLETSHAFHSSMMDPVVDEFEKVVKTVSLNRPQKPLVSTVTGTWLTDAQATDSAYWANHLRATVRFMDAVATLVDLENPLLLEVGPGHVTATLARQQTGKKSIPVLAGLVNQPDTLVAYQAVLTTLGQLYLNGLQPDWNAFYAGQQRRKVNLPTYIFDRKRCWVDPAVELMLPVTQQHTLSDAYLPYSHMNQMAKRKDTLISKINELLEDASGIDMTGVTPDMSFLEIGLDSLLLTQVAITLKKEFDLPVTFRQLTNEYSTPELLAAYLDQALPAEETPTPVPQPVAAPAQPSYTHTTPVTASVQIPLSANDSALGLIAQQLQLLAKQVALMQGDSPVPAMSPAPVPQPVVATSAPAKTASLPKAAPAKPVHVTAAELTPEEQIEHKKPFGATAKIERQIAELTDEQHFFLDRLTRRYNQKTKQSKAFAQEHRSHMADPRVVSGFRPLTKEIVYPLVVNRSKGSHLWDIDGNEYIDALNGFGSNMFGYQPEMIKQALHDQIENGYEVGPQHELAGEVSQLICDLTGADRAALCNTGSEAVLGTMRIARTVTGRSLIVAFSGSYHGIVDEVLVRGSKKLKSFPAAPGIMPESVQNMLILDYGTEESLQIIRERAHELAAVLVEPVQSRRPEFVPIDFLKQVRKITAASGTALIFDEVITGFRTHPGGAQALFGIKADLASYGKVVGAGLPIGVIAGKRTFMDALDGGFWQYGDNSAPEAGVTYFAGTFVRHPLALAAANASLQYMKKKGPSLQEGLTLKTKRLADALNGIIDRQRIPLVVVQFGSLWKIKFKEEVAYGELLFTLMREKGIHIWDGFPCFLTEAHTDKEIDTIVDRFSKSVNELIEAGFLDAKLTLTSRVQMASVEVAGEGAFPPVQGARLGRDKTGNPAWFVPNPEQPGKYLQVKLTEI
ncbi:polyketide synthase [Spirosoma oryzicola]|uniref:polyketide synthase n=1 Tax=Spirosoma oryzicola TaxID=2898794 RepID=UPI001E5EE5BC|nr:polyketide synthase [Spirosoma oryzicola]UHG91353.1 amino acid adenylation domain-containing protein [Spirosoma oryzicola]